MISGIKLLQIQPHVDGSAHGAVVIAVYGIESEFFIHMDCAFQKGKRVQ